MRLAEFAERLALPRARHLAYDVALQIELHDFAGVAVRQPHVLVGSYEQPARRAGMR